MAFQARQGDIFFRVVSVPFVEGMKRNSDNILAYGEVTGHSHRIMSPSISEMESYVDSNGDIYVRSNDREITVGHDEHNVVTLPCGEWICVSRQREYNYLESESSIVVD